MIAYDKVGYVGSDDGHVYEVDFSSGNVLSKKYFGSAIVDLWRLGDSLLITTINGKIIFCNMR